MKKTNIKTLTIIGLIITLAIGIGLYKYNLGNSSLKDYEAKYGKEYSLKNFSPKDDVLVNLTNEELGRFKVYFSGNNGQQLHGCCYGICLLECYMYEQANKTSNYYEKIIDKLNHKDMLNFEFKKTLPEFNFETDISHQYFKSDVSNRQFIRNMNNKIDENTKNKVQSLDVFSRLLEESSLDNDSICLLRDIFYLQADYLKNDSLCVKHSFKAKDVNVDIALNNLKNNIPVIIGVMPKEGSGHALFVYGYSLNNNILTLKCIDPNHPEFVSIIRFKYNLFSLKWEYIHGDSFDTINNVVEYLTPLMIKEKPVDTIKFDL